MTTPVSVLTIMLTIGALTSPLTADKDASLLDSRKPSPFAEIFRVNVTNERIRLEYNYNYTEGMAVRCITTLDNEDVSNQMELIVYDKRTVKSWSIPLVLEETTHLLGNDSTYLYSYTRVGRTLCPASKKPRLPPQKVVLEILPFAAVTVPMTIMFDLINADLVLQGPRSLLTSPAEPAILRYTFQPGQDRVLVKVTSIDRHCGMLSIQDSQCPVYDEEGTVRFVGQYATMTTLGALRVQRSDFGESFFIVLTVSPNDDECISAKDGGAGVEAFNRRTKQMSVTVLPTATPTDAFVSILGALAILLVFSLAVIPMHKLYLERSSAFPAEDEQYLIKHSDADTLSEAGISNQGTTTTSPDFKIGETDNYKDFYLYEWNLATVGIFFWIPVIQVVTAYLKIVNASGDQDVCYYNFSCAFPMLGLGAFNAIVSNMAYVILGVLFYILVKMRKNKWKNWIEQHPSMAENGVRHEYYLFFTVSLALIMQGVLSASYHVCPNTTNHQFDTAFMYVMIWIGIIQVYQRRHPSTTPSAHIAFYCIGIISLLVAFGLLWTGWVYRILFAVVHLVTVITVIIYVYYQHPWTIDWVFIRNLPSNIRRNCGIPLKKSRFGILLIVLLFNILIIAGALIYRVNFAFNLLVISLGHFLLYLAFYITKKIWHGELASWRSAIVLLVVFNCFVFSWLIAGYVFIVRGTSDFMQKPAVSREQNRDCLLLSFYDDHDIWHFTSAFGIFFSFVGLLIMDDTTSRISRSQLQVF